MTTGQTSTIYTGQLAVDFYTRRIMIWCGAVSPADHRHQGQTRTAEESDKGGYETPEELSSSATEVKVGSERDCGVEGGI
jgi:hypothetical protein